MGKQLLYLVAVCTALMASADPNDPQVALVSVKQDYERVVNV